MSEHTPGPWKVEWESCDCSEYGCSHGSYPTRIIAPAKQMPVTWSKGTTPAYVANLTESNDTTHADAHLIAAAPDLLAACKEAYATLMMLDIHFQHTGTIVRLSAAIEKAKGKQP